MVKPQQTSRQAKAGRYAGLLEDELAEMSKAFKLSWEEIGPGPVRCSLRMRYRRWVRSSGPVFVGVLLVYLLFFFFLPSEECSLVPRSSKHRGIEIYEY